MVIGIAEYLCERGFEENCQGIHVDSALLCSKKTLKPLRERFQGFY
jgi:hypothetical protein